MKTQVIALTTASKLSFEVSNGTKVEVPLPDGQQGIGYKPYVPAEIDKSGWFLGADQSTIHWRIVIPGDKISDRSSVTITDDYLQAGSNLTVSAGYPKIFWIPSTPKCWNELESAECRNDLSDSSVPSSTVTIDDDKDQVKAVLDNKGRISRPTGSTCSTWNSGPTARSPSVPSTSTGDSWTVKCAPPVPRRAPRVVVLVLVTLLGISV